MRPVAVVMLALAVALGGFAYWGTHTRAGAARFDEMAGMIPFAAGVAAVVLFAGAALTWWRIRAPAER